MACSLCYVQSEKRIEIKLLKCSTVVLDTDKVMVSDLSTTIEWQNHGGLKIKSSAYCTCYSVSLLVGSTSI